MHCGVGMMPLRYIHEGLLGQFTLVVQRAQNVHNGEGPVVLLHCIMGAVPGGRGGGR